MSKRLDFSSKCLLSCNTLTSEYKSIKEIEKLVEARSNYHVIPYMHTFDKYIKTWDLIVQILKSQLTKNKIIDIGLPFTYQKDNQNQITYPARYILYKEKILGIRIMTKSWPRYQKLEYQLPAKIQNITKQISCPIGQFCLVLSNAKIALLFQSEIELYPNILKEYFNFGCQIFLINDDLSSEQKSADQKIINKIQNFCDYYHRIVLYSSAFYAPNPKKLYIGNSFIMTGNTLLKETSISIYQNSQILKAYVDIDEINKKTDYSKQKFIDTTGEIKEVEEELTLKRKVLIQEEQQTKKKITLNERQSNKYFIWYLFKKINGMAPFIISANLSYYTCIIIHYTYNIMQDMLKNYINIWEFNQITEGKILRKLLFIYDYDNSESINKHKNSYLIEIKNYLHDAYLQLKKIQKFQQIYPRVINRLNFIYEKERLCFYTENQNQIEYLTRVINGLPDNNIFICRELLNVIDRNQSEVRKIFDTYMLTDKQLSKIVSQESKEEKFIKDLLRRNYTPAELFIRLHQEFSDQNKLKKIYTEIIPRQIKKNIKNDQITDYFINTPWEIHQKQHNEYYRKKEPLIKEIKNQDEQLDKKIQMIKSLKKKKLYACHYCSLLLQQTYGERNTCQYQHFICLDCLKNENILKMKLKKSDCIICKNLCECKKCKQNKKIVHSQIIKQGCHKCSLKLVFQMPIFILCSDIKCKYQFCLDCVKINGNKQDDDQISILNSKFWICYVCRRTCGCYTCQQRINNQKLKQKEKKEYLRQIKLREQKQQYEKLQQIQNERRMIIQKERQKQKQNEYEKEKEKEKEKQIEKQKEKEKQRQRLKQLQKSKKQKQTLKQKQKKKVIEIDQRQKKRNKERQRSYDNQKMKKKTKQRQRSRERPREQSKERSRDRQRILNMENNKKTKNNYEHKYKNSSKKKRKHNSRSNSRQKNSGFKYYRKRSISDSLSSYSSSSSSSTPSKSSSLSSFSQLNRQFINKSKFRNISENNTKELSKTAMKIEFHEKTQNTSIKQTQQNKQIVVKDTNIIKKARWAEQPDSSSSQKIVISKGQPHRRFKQFEEIRSNNSNSEGDQIISTQKKSNYKYDY